MFHFSFSVFLSVTLCLCGVVLSACGYRVAGRGTRLPAEIKSIAVPAFVNHTARYRIEQRLTEAVVRELLNRTKYRVVPEPANADAALFGEVTAIESNAVLFDTATGRATTMVVTVQMRVRLEETATKKILWRNDAFVFREQFEISTDVASFFEEQDPALGRLAREFAATLVSALLENF
jgi:hypothetical protein